MTRVKSYSPRRKTGRVPFQQRSPDLCPKKAEKKAEK